MKANTPHFFILLALLFTPFVSNSQLNLQVGYGLGFTNFPIHSQITDLYKLKNPWLDQGFKELKYMNGMMAGFRYSWNSISTGLNWRFRQAKLEAKGMEPITMQDFSKTLHYNLQAFSVLLETHGGFLNLGSTIEYNLLNIKEIHTNSENKQRVLHTSVFGSQFYVNINFPASRLCRISLQPYYFLGWSPISMQTLENHLSGTQDAEVRKQSLNHFGINLILNNGPQH
ncbi:MAG: hypothetical protein IPO78_04005 [Saprospiraceae bacterium]|nr:hypothetical protein [Saprospiraceae bacterium]